MIVPEAILATTMTLTSEVRDKRSSLSELRPRSTTIQSTRSMSRRHLCQLHKSRNTDHLISIFLTTLERQQKSHPICWLDRNEKQRPTNLKRKSSRRFANPEWWSVLICEPPFDSVPRCGSEPPPKKAQTHQWFRSDHMLLLRPGWKSLRAKMSL